MLKKLITIFVLCALCAFVTSNSYDLKNVDPIFEQHQLAFKLVRHAYGKRMSIVGTASDDACFDYYYQEQDEIFTQYNKDFNICRTDARAAKAKLQAETSEKREGTIARGDLTCSDLKNCDQYTDGMEFFECYSSASGGNYQELYNLYLDSNAETTNIKVTTQSITNDENKCVTTAKNKYVASMANCNTNLDKCLGGAPLPTTPESSEETDEPASSSTEPPTSSTPESSEETDEPASSSTEPPTSSTPESSEETEEPASSSTEPPTSSTPASSEETDEPASSSTEPPTSSTSESSEETGEPASSSTEPPSSSTSESSEETDEPASSSTERPTSSTSDSSEETDEPASSSTEPPSSEETDAPESSESTTEPEAPEGSTTDPPPEEDLFSLKSNFNLWNLLKKFRA